MDLRYFLIFFVGHSMHGEQLHGGREGDQIERHMEYVVHIDKPHWTGVVTRIAPLLFLPLLFYMMHASPPDAEASTALHTVYSLKDFVGAIPEELRVLVEYVHNNVIREALYYHGVAMAKGCILYGKPGVGKTFLAQCIAGELKVPCIALTAADIFNSKWMGSAVRNVSALLNKARFAARNNERKVCIIIIDEADSLLNARFSADSPIAQEYNNAVNTFLSGIDGINSEGDGNILLYTIACTNSRMSDLDPAFQRSGRFEAQIEIMPPHEDEALKIFQYYLKKFRVLSVRQEPLALIACDQQVAIENSLQILYTHYALKQGYISAVDIKRAIEKALVSTYLALQLTVSQKKYRLGAWINFLFMRQSLSPLSQQIEMLRNSGKLLSRVLGEINRQASVERYYDLWHDMIV